MPRVYGEPLARTRRHRPASTNAGTPLACIRTPRTPLACIRLSDSRSARHGVHRTLGRPFRTPPACIRLSDCCRTKCIRLACGRTQCIRLPDGRSREVHHTARRPQAVQMGASRLLLLPGGRVPLRVKRVPEGPPMGRTQCIRLPDRRTQCIRLPDGRTQCIGRPGLAGLHLGASQGSGRSGMPGAALCAYLGWLGWAWRSSDIADLRLLCDLGDRSCKPAKSKPGATASGDTHRPLALDPMLDPHAPPTSVGLRERAIAAPPAAVPEVCAQLGRYSRTRLRQCSSRWGAAKPMATRGTCDGEWSVRLAPGARRFGGPARSV